MWLSKKEKIRYVLAYNAGERIETPEGFPNRTAFKASLLNWVKRYNSEGESGLDRRPVRHPSAEQKEAIADRFRKGERIVDIANGTGYSPSSISKWCKGSSRAIENQVKYPRKEENFMPETEKKPVPENETPEEKIRRLEAENERFRAEIAVLKKSIALKVMKARQQKKRK